MCMEAHAVFRHVIAVGFVSARHGAMVRGQEPATLHSATE